MGNKVKELNSGTALKTYLFWSPADDQHIGISSAWGFNGNYELPTFTPSVLMTGGSSDPNYKSHMFVTDGKIQYLADCTHAMAGQTVDMVDIDESYFKEEGDAADENNPESI